MTESYYKIFTIPVERGILKDAAFEMGTAFQRQLTTFHSAVQKAPFYFAEGCITTIWRYENEQDKPSLVATFCIDGIGVNESKDRDT